MKRDDCETAAEINVKGVQEKKSVKNASLKSGIELVRPGCLAVQWIQLTV